MACAFSISFNASVRSPLHFVNELEGTRKSSTSIRWFVAAQSIGAERTWSICGFFGLMKSVDKKETPALTHSSSRSLRIFMNPRAAGINASREYAKEAGDGQGHF
jgi:hypothetical protein